MGTIQFRNNGISPSIRGKIQLKIFLASVFADERTDFRSLTYIFCKDEYLLSLNQHYLQHDTLTDIITFTLSGQKESIISEIYISLERIRENSKKFHATYTQELLRVMIHGILHLCGYSDHNKNLKAEMRKKENFYLTKYCFT